ncbi:hypothetical protein [Williamsia sterculiae]|uniref:hypothetical protein n=1 Tax=Williamsia sterculiae TaxID=1344003 RepID=UPI001F37D0D8|nr:hypothetical protein [Williamsia sterculiae]
MTDTLGPGASASAADPLGDAATSTDHRRFTAGDGVSLLLAVGLLVAAIVAPLLASVQYRISIFALAQPLFGTVDPHWGTGTVPAVLIAALGIVAGPPLAARLRWPALLATVFATGLAWVFSLAMIDGWDRGIAGRLVRQDEYLHEVPGVRGSSIPTILDHFASRILDFRPDSWTVHVSGHPPGALITFVVLDRLGLSGGGWAAVWVIVTGTSAAVAGLLAVRALAGEEMARRCAPFLALGPGAVWIGVSADGYFMAVAAWGIALLALSATRRGRASAAFGAGAGLFLGFAIFLNYGLTLMGVISLAVLVVARSWRPLLFAVPAALAVVGVFAALGFWWLDGYHLVVERYYQGVASERPFSYWGWADFAAALCAIGPAGAVGLGRALHWRRLRDRMPVAWLSVSGVACMVCADLSALSKAETERIWLPFGFWIMVGTALLPRRMQRPWLLLQVLTALLINHIVRTYW